MKEGKKNSFWCIFCSKKSATQIVCCQKWRKLAVTSLRKVSNFLPNFRYSRVLLRLFLHLADDYSKSLVLLLLLTVTTFWIFLLIMLMGISDSINLMSFKTWLISICLDNGWCCGLRWPTFTIIIITLAMNLIVLT